MKGVTDLGELVGERKGVLHSLPVFSRSDTSKALENLTFILKRIVSFCRVSPALLSLYYFCLCAKNIKDQLYTDAAYASLLASFHLLVI